MARRKSRIKTVYRHMPPGWEAWKNDRKIRGPQYGFIFAIMAMMFGCGVIVASVVAFTTRPSLALSLPTLAVVSVLPTATTTPATLSLVVQSVPTSTLTPSPTYTPDKREVKSPITPTATLTPSATISPTSAIWCEGAPRPEGVLSAGTEVVVQFDNPDESSLNLLDIPRTTGSVPLVKRLVYHGWRLRVLGETRCGSWRGQPVIYYAVDVLAVDDSGWVGYGAEEDTWLVVR